MTKINQKFLKLSTKAKYPFIPLELTMREQQSGKNVERNCKRKLKVC